MYAPLNQFPLVVFLNLDINTHFLFLYIYSVISFQSSDNSHFKYGTVIFKSKNPTLYLYHIILFSESELLSIGDEAHRIKSIPLHKSILFFCSFLPANKYIPRCNFSCIG